ncbi:MAG: Rrf2 family transcriptional regulator [Oscillospiraceae bacterium]|nr:Rrf2 family transcriptional regulator [Oscillospiraceae bacterium]
MMISSKGRYALHVMVDLAQHDGEGLISLKSIAERQELSLKYLENIVAVLAHAGLLVGQRGKVGGYRLTRSPAEYTVAEIVSLTEGGLAPVACLHCGAKGCEKAAECLTLPVWRELDSLVTDYLARVTIADLVNGTVPSARLLD